MVMQAVAFYVFTVQIIYECYVTMMILYNNFTYEKLTDFSCIYFWITISMIKMIIFNNICEKIYIKVYIFTKTHILQIIQLYNVLFIYYSLY